METKMYSARSFEDLAIAFDAMSSDFAQKATAPKDTVAAKRFNSGVCYGYKQAAIILRNCKDETAAERDRLRAANEGLVALIRRIQGALGTGEEGDNLVAVAHDSHAAEMELAAKIREEA